MSGQDAATGGVTGSEEASWVAARSTRERVLRRFAGAGAVAALVGAGALVLAPAWVPWALVAVVAVYLVGVPVSWWVGRRWGDVPGSVVRHAVAGGAAGGTTGAVLGLPGLLLALPLFYGVVAGVVGFLAGGLGAAVGLHLPRRSLLLATVVGPCAVGLLAASAWSQSRPPSPWDHVVVNPTPEVADLGGAAGLANLLVAGVDEAGDAGDDLTAHSTWVAVAGASLPADLGDSELWVRYTEDDRLPVRPGTAERVRPVTVTVRTSTLASEPARAFSPRGSAVDRVCLLVSAGGTTTRPGSCADLDLVDLGS